MTLKDAQARQTALDIRESFIVQAPAGSGKTELLTQRFLALLATVEKPESILAITFTRKAAQEMRERILDRLKMAANSGDPQEAHAQTTYRLAKAVLTQNTERGWQLLDNPRRLKIQTIDSFCAELANTLPLTSELGAINQVTEKPWAHYQQAIQSLVNDAERDGYADTLTTLLLHLDNNLRHLSRLMSEMLATRDQWLPYVYAHKGHLKATADSVLANINQQQLAQLESAIPENIKKQAQGLLNALTIEPGTTLWHSLRALLMTQDGQWRKTFTAQQGLPSTASLKTAAEKDTVKALKAQLLALCEALDATEDVKDRLARVSELPPEAHSHSQWHVLQALFDLLPIAAAKLRLVWFSHSTVDFTEVHLAALHALGQFEAPSDLALALDYQLQHILVDEFQDTSSNQHHLLALLTQAWQAGDGRTLFCVGDPMQSIYRFRHAEVGLFLSVKDYGLGEIKPKFLALSSNFRSQADLVNWFNQSFQAIFPQLSDLQLGAVHYHAAAPIKPSENQAPRLCIAHDEPSEAAHIATLVEDTLNTHPNERIAILVRAKSQALLIFDALRARQIPFKATDIQPLASKPWVLDACSLLRAVLHLDDRTAWLATLRAPWCGLTLNSLFALSKNRENTLWENIQYAELCDDEQTRLQSVKAALETALNFRQQLSYSEILLYLWSTLKADTLYAGSQRNDMTAFFKLLRQEEARTPLLDADRFERELQGIFSNSDEDSLVEIMTIHKSKGLEFDTVIIPACQKRTLKTDSPLLLHAEFPRENDGVDLLLSPLPARGDDDAVYRYLQSLNKQKDEFENCRLLYVAATRAKKRLYFTATLDEDKNATRHSFLDYIQEHIQTDTIELDTSDTQPKPALVRRLNTDNLPKIEPKLFQGDQFELTVEPQRAALIGELLHEALEQISHDGVAQWSEQRIHAQRDYWLSRLNTLGLNEDELQRAIATLTSGLTHCLSDEKAQWILQPHKEAASEFAVTLPNGEKRVIDRTFVDEHGTRWIIDYKSAQCGNLALNTFLDKQTVQYAAQLYEYRDIVSAMYPEPVKLALYFPLEQLWLPINKQHTQDQQGKR